jgi:hypothetical protein
MAGCGLAADDCIFFGIRSGMCVENELLRSGIGGHSPLEESVITSMYVGIRSIRIFADFDLASKLSLPFFSASADDDDDDDGVNHER